MTKYPEQNATIKIPELRSTLKKGLVSGVKKGWSSFLWMMRILVPVSLVVALLKWSGWLHKADFIFDPVMQLLNLPSEAVFPILSGIFIGIYAIIAIFTVVPFTVGQMTIIAVFTLICHNIITEAVIQHNSGINGLKITGIRLLAAVATVMAISPFFNDTSISVAGMLGASQQETIWQVLKEWGIDTGWMLLKIWGIITGIMVVLESLTALKWDIYLFRFFRPFMKVLGLSDRTVILWVTAVVFGLMYGSAVILEKTKQENFTRSELERLHISIGINHSMVEDPLLLLALGIGAFWLWVPKLVTAIICAQAYRGFEYLKIKLTKARSGAL